MRTAQKILFGTELPRGHGHKGKLSTKMSAYFHRDVLLAFPKIKEVYIRLVFWKLLASSLPALISGFDKAKKRLQGVLEGQEELAELNSITEYAENITQSARSKAFIEIVCKALIELHSNNCEERIIVFSENTVTLQYLFTLLKEYKFPVTLCTHGNEERAIRSFKRTSKILLTTDSFAQSYDIPFCSCVINYDVPWSIQKSYCMLSYLWSKI